MFALYCLVTSSHGNALVHRTPHLSALLFLQDIARNVQVALSPEHPTAGQTYSLTLKFDLSEEVRIRDAMRLQQCAHPRFIRRCPPAR